MVTLALPPATSDFARLIALAVERVGLLGTNGKIFLRFIRERTPELLKIRRQSLRTSQRIT